jgi:hypothetical protein
LVFLAKLNFIIDNWLNYNGGLRRIGGISDAPSQTAQTFPITVFLDKQIIVASGFVELVLLDF